MPIAAVQIKCRGGFRQFTKNRCIGEGQGALYSPKSMKFGQSSGRNEHVMSYADISSTGNGEKHNKVGHTTYKIITVNSA